MVMAIRQTNECNVTAQVSQEAQNFQFSIFNFPFTKPAFTLAEVLITLGIIGVVAAMTIPTLMNSTQDKEFKAKLLKEYSVLSQVQGLLAVDNGGDFSSVFSSCTADGTTGETCMKNIFKTKLNYTKECDSGATLGTCISAVADIKYLNGSAADAWGLGNGTGGIAGLVLNDGTSMTMHLDSSTCSDVISYGALCGWTTVDVNGLQKPNQWGKDIYLFYILSNKIIPASATTESSDDCGAGTNYGRTCAGKYISGN